MAAHTLPKEVWLLIRESHRHAPGAHTRAAKYASTAVATVRKAWETGWPNDLDPDMRRPLKDTIAEEQEHARARLVELETETARMAAELESKRRHDVAEKARQDANVSRVEEAQLIRVARGTVGDTLAGLANAAKGALALGRKVEETFSLWAADTAKTLSLKEAKDVVSLLKDTAGAVKSITEAGHQAMQMERLLLGEPTSIVGHAHLKDVTLDEAERRIAASTRALERARRLNLLPASASTSVVDGEARPANVLAEPAPAKVA